MERSWGGWSGYGWSQDAWDWNAKVDRSRPAQEKERVWEDWAQWATGRIIDIYIYIYIYTYIHAYRHTEHTHVGCRLETRSCTCIHRERERRKKTCMYTQRERNKKKVWAYGNHMLLSSDLCV